MSNRGGGGSSVTIPKNVKKTIQSIREITGKQHSDEDIYSVLQDCAMDLDDTAQKLLYLDTFHEVKRKHDRRKGAQERGAEGRSRKLFWCWRWEECGYSKGKWS
ncbi:FLOCCULATION PROTEIN (DUF1296) [Salix koriyanagi]|uniref:FLOCCULATION PROTEIN (DUF1296) n=1 Tax=Salix koriyanagi TaxID=2511006 RepID=A0A9Q0X1E2_9ROSI|nr:FLOCCULATION PROTEIN (DUF1296) [Salix koriyanagi]